MDIIDKIKDILDIREILKELFEWEEENDWNAEDAKPELRPGDIICVSRGFYDHFGVYCGNDSVIHFSSHDSDISANNEIIETNLRTFKRSNATLRKLVFPKRHKAPKEISLPNSFAATELLRFPLFNFFETYKLYSPEETIERAKSKIGGKGYNLFFNNCEHFAIWCKTGIHESHQVNKLLDVIFKRGLKTI